MNKAEEKFKNFCKNRQWKIYIIPELPNIKTPDFFVVVDNNPFIVEVKELSKSGPNRKDIEKIEINGKIIGQSGDYNKEVDSITRKIKEANNQFKTTASFNLPNLLIIYSNRQFVVLDKEKLLSAMYGKHFQRLRIGSKDGKVSTHPLPPLITNRTLRRDRNNLVSAIGIRDNKNGMFIAHNLWAKNPLPFIFRDKNDKNYVPHEIKFKVL